VAKFVMVFFAAVACIQLIKPIGWPGLKQRRDAWKLVLAGFMAVVVLIGIRLASDLEPSPPKSGGENSQTGGKSR
jgi:hypothetical protein